VIPFDWHWAFAWEVLPLLLQAAGVTLQATLLGSALAIPIGLALALARRSRLGGLAWISHWWMEFIRSTPLLVQIYFLYYVGPEYGFNLSPLATGVIALGMHYGAYLSEVFRSGIDGVERGQWEAAVALNLSRYHSYRDVILPQALGVLVPASGNYLIAMFKETPQLSAITLLEMLQLAKILGAENFRYLEPFTLVGVIYLVLSLVASWGIRRLEQRLPRSGIPLR